MLLACSPCMPTRRKGREGGLVAAWWDQESSCAHLVSSCPHMERKRMTMDGETWCPRGIIFSLAAPKGSSEGFWAVAPCIPEKSNLLGGQESQSAGRRSSADGLPQPHARWSALPKAAAGPSGPAGLPLLGVFSVQPPPQISRMPWTLEPSISSLQGSQRWTL